MIRICRFAFTISSLKEGFGVTDSGLRGPKNVCQMILGPVKLIIQW